MMCTDFIEAGEQLQTELAMEPRVFSGGTPYPKRDTPYPRTMGPAGRVLRGDVYTGLYFRRKKKGDNTD